MKIFKLLLSLYILTLSCFPCGDVEDCIGKDALKISEVSHHKNHQHTTESCTPFCTCSCCAASTVFQYTAAVVETPKVIFATLKFAKYQVSARSEISSSIWQPPKIVS